MSDWSQALDALEAGLPDERVREAMRELIEGCGGELDYDGVRVRLSADTPILIEQKALVLERGGAFLSARVAIDPIHENGEYTGLNRGGTIRFRLSLAGEYLDEVYSRDRVVE